jgi:hypothetical protein
MIGEFAPLTEPFVARAPPLDVVTWHYYPLQSSRCPVAVRRATAAANLDPDVLDEVNQWAAQVEAARDAHQPSAQVWLGESGNAQCGGEPGVSDAFAGAFWWLDQLGQLARRGQAVTVRQTLVGATYGLLEASSLDPNPDYWIALLHKRLMGTTVLGTTSDHRRLRVYAHCARGRPGAIVLMLANLDPDRGAIIELSGLERSSALELYRLTADGLSARAVRLNGVPLAATSGQLPELVAAEGATGDPARIGLAAASLAFAVLPDARAPACTAH